MEYILSIICPPIGVLVAGGNWVDVLCNIAVGSIGILPGIFGVFGVLDILHALWICVRK